MIRNCDVLEGDLFGVLKERIRTPHGLEPRGGQETVVGRQIVRKTQPVILPFLREENVRSVRLFLSIFHFHNKKKGEKKRENNFYDYFVYGVYSNRRRRHLNKLN